MTRLTEQEFLDLLARHRKEFAVHLRRNLWSQSDRADVLAEAGATAWPPRARFRRGTNFRAWMCRMLTNKLYVANRRTLRQGTAPSPLPELSAPAELPRHTATHSRWFIEYLSDELSDAWRRQVGRECLRLRALESCSYREIARLLDLPLGTLVTHLSRGRARLRLQGYAAWLPLFRQDAGDRGLRRELTPSLTT